ncbi:GH1 family beta-glucosidase [Aliiglaciecola sp. 2_MG-2023]|uniref:GH1 family beta-glucosidase n=1 Tax=unclassified Aliiglaciecola TaxID=2593648 RepID=UPI0026E2AFBB|nr:MULTISPECIES: GH1 family beta-glucosidase [unclassified Aliiglaciecola]MDO6710763.1 GH1 family beta-glucosidase [Aliiglaciecola sp. 2_MG-2023]MDO6751829.1 GH1 family beta-glucosidase [Aliiglaciecola sp. 1_MG-2023]
MSNLSLPSSSKLLDHDFVFGVATSSFQIEGAADSRLESIWDTFCATPGKISDASNGLVACEHVKFWREDVELIDSLGVDAYRFSISWPRVVKKDGSLNDKGMQFYIDLVEELVKRNIKPFVTLYHWDLPQHLEEKGGWLNRETAFHFEHYVNLVAKALGDRVYAYATLNEPFCSAYLGYENGVHAPGKTGQANGRKSAHHLLLAHGLGIRALRRNCPDTKAGIVLNFTPCYPETQVAEDIKAAKIADDYINQWYMRPVMEGLYPDVVELIEPQNRPDILPGDMDLISQRLDFLGVNFYTRLKYRSDGKGWYEELQPKGVVTTDMGWEVYPKALSELLISLHQRYTLPPVYITENGAAMQDEIKHGRVNDQDRIDYFQSHLNAVDDASQQGVDIAGYFAWSLMDNFEWAEGYEKRFGIVYVDYLTQSRTIKDSGLAYKQLITSR